MSTIEYDFPTTCITCPIESITGVWEFKRPPFFKYLCHSLSGHLLHFVTKGGFIVKINGREYQVGTGDVIYYYESEEVETIGNETEVVFYSVSYQAPKLLPFPLEKRVFTIDGETQGLFHQLHNGFSSDNVMTRSFMAYSTLLNILNSIEGISFDFRNKVEEEELWWAIERRIRKDTMFKPSLDKLLKISGYSKSSIIRSCRKTTGDTPIQRIRKIRMEMAKGLLSFGHLNVTQVAEYLGYIRLHEFSREFSKYYGEPPSKLLKK